MGVTPASVGRKAADAVIDELGNGDVAAAVLEAVREGGETLFSSKASGSGIVLDEANSDDSKNKGKTSNLIKITLERPMGIVFEPIGDPQECSGVRILELTRRGKAHLSQELKVGDELLSMNGTNMTKMTFYDVVKSMSKGDAFDMTFKRPNKRGLGFSNLMKRNASKKGNKTVDQRENETLCQTSLVIASKTLRVRTLIFHSNKSFFVNLNKFFDQQWI